MQGQKVLKDTQEASPASVHWPEVLGELFSAPIIYSRQSYFPPRFNAYIQGALPSSYRSFPPLVPYQAFHLACRCARHPFLRGMFSKNYTINDQERFLNSLFLKGAQWKLCKSRRKVVVIEELHQDRSIDRCSRNSLWQSPTAIPPRLTRPDSWGSRGGGEGGSQPQKMNACNVGMARKPPRAAGVRRSHRDR